MGSIGEAVAARSTRRRPEPDRGRLPGRDRPGGRRWTGL